MQTHPMNRDGVFYPFRAIGHRGAAGHAPENTLASFRKAAALGVRWVELDVQLTADGVAVLFHDDDLKRVTGTPGTVGGTDSATLSLMDVGSWFSADYADATIPTLAQALTELAALGLGAVIEIKEQAGQEERVADAVSRLIDERWPDALPQPLVASFSPRILSEMGKREGVASLALNADKVTSDAVSLARSLGCSSVHCNHRNLQREGTRPVLETGMGLRCYTVNDAERAKTLFRWGVQAVRVCCPGQQRLFRSLTLCPVTFLLGGAVG